MIPAVKEAYHRIEEALTKIDSHEEWTKFLSFHSKFHNYSFQNSMLIYDQYPQATFVAGFKTWQNLGRHVKKGEKAIKIFAPCKYKTEDKATNDPIYVIKGFKLVNVFDIDQTEGDEVLLPVLVTGLKGNVGNADVVYKALQEALELPVKELSDLTAKGHYNETSKAITINSSLDTIHKIKTLLHEYAHYIHVTHYPDNEPEDLCELIAESVAFIVSNYLNFDTSDYSFPYIASWLKDPKELKIIGSKVTKIASDIISLLQSSDKGLTLMPESPTY